MTRNAGAASVLYTSPCPGELLQAQHSCWGSNKVFYCCKGFLDKLLQGNTPWTPDWGCGSPISGVMILKKVEILGRKAGRGQRFVLPPAHEAQTPIPLPPGNTEAEEHTCDLRALYCSLRLLLSTKKKDGLPNLFFFFQVKQGHKRMVYYRFTNTESFKLNCR